MTLFYFPLFFRLSRHYSSYYCCKHEFISYLSCYLLRCFPRKVAFNLYLWDIYYYYYNAHFCKLIPNYFLMLTFGYQISFYENILWVMRSYRTFNIFGFFRYFPVLFAIFYRNKILRIHFFFRPNLTVDESITPVDLILQLLEACDCSRAMHIQLFTNYLQLNNH